MENGGDILLPVKVGSGDQLGTVVDFAHATLKLVRSRGRCFY